MAQRARNERDGGDTPGAAGNAASEPETRRRRSVLLTGVLLGIGIASFLDETILHQLLQWHTFYWDTDQRGRILSDGIFHVFSTSLLLWGAYRLWRTPRDWMQSHRGALLAAILIGLGGFQIYDGLFDHLVFHVHLVNEQVCPVVNANNSIASCPQDIPYEIVFTSIGIVVLVVGILWWRQTARMGQVTGPTTGPVTGPAAEA
jgi:uncharacterized membrane protein